MLKTLAPRKIRDQAVQQIKDLIVDQRLTPGDRLPTETQLAASLGVSRLSVREATKALEFLGIIESKTGVGLTVGRLDVARVSQHLGFHPALHCVDPQQLIDTRVVLEIGALPFVARRMAADASLYPSLVALAERLHSARQVQQWIELDIEFHRALLEASGLAPLVAFGDLLHVFFQRFRESVKKAEWKSGMASHRRILDALRDGQVTLATDELRKHIESHKARL